MKAWTHFAVGSVVGAIIAGGLMAGVANGDTGDARVAALEARIANLEAQTNSATRPAVRSLNLTATDEIVLATGKAQIRMRKSGQIDISGGPVNIDSNSDVRVKGSKIGGN